MLRLEKRIIYLAGLIFFILSNAVSQTLFSPQMEKIVNEYVEKKNNKGLVVGIVYDTEIEIRGYGVISEQKRQKPDGNTIFEIGGMTQVFTTGLMMLESYKGTYSLGDRVEDYAPAGVHIPNYKHLICTEYSLPPDFDGYEFDNRVVSCREDLSQPAICIAFCDLATHTAGLPEGPGGFFRRVFRKNNPYKNYSKNNLYRDIEKYPPVVAPGASFHYSDLGMALLGNIVADINSVSYGELLRTVLTEPLGMTNTAVALDPIQEKKLVPGHNRKGKRVNHWQLTGMAPAGGIKSSANDLVKLLQVNLALSGDQLIQDACEQTQAPQLDVDGLVLGRPTAVGYGWFISESRPGNNAAMVWATGSTAGFRSFIGFVKSSSTGVVVLSNSANGVEDIGFSLLEILHAESQKKMPPFTEKGP